MFGRFCLVLHGHLPWVLHHGRWPHGEDWLFEAVAETWLPLASVLERCAEEGLKPAWTLGMTPILLEQLASVRFRDGMEHFLLERAERSRIDAAEFEATERPGLAALAARWEKHFLELHGQFLAADRDICAIFKRHEREGRIELLSSNATHGYHPLLLHERCARAQLRAGLVVSERHLGRRPAGIWLPECAYRPPGELWPVAVYKEPREVLGVGKLASDAGVRFFFVDTHLVRRSRAHSILIGDQPQPVDPSQAAWDTLRAWNSELEPCRVAEGDEVLPLSVLARCPEVSEQVWSGKIGYPGDGRYLEFHKRHGLRGLRYWRVTSSEAELGDKEPYEPEAVDEAIEAQADHFCALVCERLRKHGEKTGRVGTVCAPFDAELFGHWWHEGPKFLLAIARRMAREPALVPSTVSGLLDLAPPDKAVQLPEGSWGAGGDHRVWANDELRFYWEVAYRAEDRFVDLWHRAPWQSNPVVEELLTEAARQLLLLQASDWPFVISTRGAVDYGMRRIFEHASLFDDLCNGVEDAILASTDPEAPPPDPIVASALDRSRLLDPVFPDLSLQWWA